MNTKSRLAALMSEENNSAPVVSEMALAAPAVKAKVQGRGRPKTKPESKLASFHLPLDLIERLTRAAGENKSAFAVKALDAELTRQGF